MLVSLVLALAPLYPSTSADESVDAAFGQTVVSATRLVLGAVAAVCGLYALLGQGAAEAKTKAA